MITTEAVLNHGLKSAEFSGLSPEELIAKCREYRAEAERMAATASGEMRKGYSYLVMEWSTLADEIEKGIHQSSCAQAAYSLAPAVVGLWSNTRTETFSQD